MRKLIFIMSAFLLIGAACTTRQTTMNTNTPFVTPDGSFSILPETERTNVQARVETEKGSIVFELFGSESPIAISSFVTLANKGYFDRLTFHRYEPGFVIQGGDPQGNGSGGPGYQFIDESVTRDYTRGTVAMANAGPDTNGSQFFIVLQDALALPKSYTIFGFVTQGLDVVDQIRAGDVMKRVTIEPKSS